MNALTGLKRSVGQAWDSLADGWRQLRDRAAGAVTRFSPSREVATSDAANDETMPASWGLLAVDMYDTDDQVIVRLEAPGLSKNDLALEVRDDVLYVRGEKRFERESRQGNYRLMQCAYGRFSRAVPLPVAVNGDRASATYRDGVLRIELPKAESARARRISVKAA